MSRAGTSPAASLRADDPKIPLTLRRLLEAEAAAGGTLPWDTPRTAVVRRTLEGAMSTGWNADLVRAVPTHEATLSGGGVGSASGTADAVGPQTQTPAPTPSQIGTARTSAGGTGTGLRDDELDQVVERVAARLEERIVEELERRSRRRGVTSWG